MFRKAFLTIALIAFCMSTVVGCAKPASKAKPVEKPAATTDKAPADKAPAEKAPAAKTDDKKAEPAKKAETKVDLPPAAQAPPSVSE